MLVRLFAAGNSDGGIQMLEWTTSGPGPCFGMPVHHTDAERESACDRESHFGKLDKGLDDAQHRARTVINMKADWKSIYPDHTKKPFMKPQTIAIAGLLATTLGTFAGTSSSVLTPTSPVPVEPASSDDWSFEIAPYIWAASIESDTSLPWNGSDEPDSAQRLDTKITGAFMIEALARYRSVGLLVDFNWLQLDTDTLHSGTAFSGANLQSDFIYSTAALTYTLPLCGDFHMDLMAGARLWHVSTDFDLESGTLPGFSSSNSETWTSPIIGASIRYQMTGRWSLLGQGVWGGFDSDSTQWDLYGGFGYKFSDWCTGTLGYRYLNEEFETGDYTLNIEAQGAQLGLRFTF